MNELKNPRDIVAFVEDNFKNLSTNTVLFGCEYLEARDVRDFSILYRMLLLTYSCIYAKWLNCDREIDKINLGRHAQNVFGIFKLIYKLYDFDLDVLIYVITESKRDVLENGANSFFSEFFDVNVDCKYSKLYDIIRVAFEEGNYKPQEIIEHFSLMVVDLKILYSLDIEEKLTSSSTKEYCLSFNDKSYKTFDVISFNNNSYCILKSRSVLNSNVERVYQSIENFEKFSLITNI